MGLHWFIDSRQRLIVVTAEGPVSRADIDGLLDAVTGAKALAYRKLVDATAGKFAMSAVDLLAIGVRVRSLHAGSVGAAALVLPGRLPRDGEPDDAPTWWRGSSASLPRPKGRCGCSRAWRPPNAGSRA